MNLWYPASEPAWPDRLGPAARETWARFTQMHAGKGTTVWRGVLEAGGPAYYFKVFAPRGPLDRWKDLLRAPRAVRAHRNAWRAEKRGFAVIRPVCLMTGPRGAGDLLVTREESGAAGLRGWLRGIAPRAQRTRVLAALGQEIARWHAAGLFHADLNLDNLMLRWEGDAPRFVWLDLEGMHRFLFGVPVARRAKNLADINYERPGLSRTDRMRIWCAYQDAAGLPAAVALKLRAQVLARTERRWRKRGFVPGLGVRSH